MARAPIRIGEQGCQVLSLRCPEGGRKDWGGRARHSPAGFLRSGPSMTPRDTLRPFLCLGSAHPLCLDLIFRGKMSPSASLQPGHEACRASLGNDHPGLRLLALTAWLLT